MNRATHFASVTMLLGVAAPAVSVSSIDRANRGDSLSSVPSALTTELRLARSDDGLTFEDTGKVFLTHAAVSSPCLTMPKAISRRRAH
jgi:hypothetical protein